MGKCNWHVGNINGLYLQIPNYKTDPLQENLIKTSDSVEINPISHPISHLSCTL